MREDAIEIWNAGVTAVHGRTLVEKSVRADENTLFVDQSSFELSDFDRILIVGGGKFSHFMAEGIESILGNELSNAKNLSGLITVPDGSNKQVALRFIEAAECRPKGINLPTDRVLIATNRMLDLLGEVDERTLVIALISGGGSALLESSSLPVTETIAATNWLSSRGANIIELNTVRIALSHVKGGGLVHAMPAGTLIGLIVSDVPNDDIRFVSSGPTVDMGPGVFANAREVVEKFESKSGDTFPEAAKRVLFSKVKWPEVSCSVSNFLIGNANVASDAAIAKAIELGYEVLDDCLAETNDCEQIADAATKWICRAGHGGSQCVVSLGEPIVEPGDSAGQGGRNQHAVLSTTQRLLQTTPIGSYCFLSAGTDGEDGNTSVAGAAITNQDIVALTDQADELNQSLDRFDSHPFLARHDLVFESGPTATNVADLRVLLRRT